MRGTSQLRALTEEAEGCSVGFEKEFSKQIYSSSKWKGKFVFTLVWNESNDWMKIETSDRRSRNEIVETIQL